MLENCETLEEAVEEALQQSVNASNDKLDEIAVELLDKIRGWMNDVAHTVADGPAMLPETVKAEEARLAE